MIYIAGKNNIAVSALEYLYNIYGSSELKVLCNKTDNGQDSWQRSFKKRAGELNVQEVELSQLALDKNDIFISLEFDKIVKNLGCEKVFNIHFSQLPKYKGMYTSVHPILNGEKQSGVTLHKIDNGIDTGDIIDQHIFVIKDEDRGQDLYRNYIKNSISLFLKNIDNIISGNFSSKKQSAECSSYYSRKSIDFKNIEINFYQTAWGIKNFIYAFTFRAYQLVKFMDKPIACVEILESKSYQQPGIILRRNQNYVDIATIDYDVRLFFEDIGNNLMRFSIADKHEIPFLLKTICGINDRNHLGWSPIIVSAYHGNIDAVETLISLGADVNDINYNGTSVLMYAKDYCIKHKSRELFDYLIQQGANIDHQDFRGKKLIDYLSLSESKILGI